MIESLFNLSGRSSRRAKPIGRSCARLALERLEDRLAPAQTIQFTINSSQSSLTLTGSYDNSSLSAQGPGSLVSLYSGAFPSPSIRTPTRSASPRRGPAWRPTSAATGNPRREAARRAASADYGGQLPLNEVYQTTALLALRNVTASLSTSAPLALSGPAGSQTFNSTQTLTLTNGAVTTRTCRRPYSASHHPSLFQPGSTNLSGDSAINAAGAGTLTNLGNGNYSLTVPINATINQSFAGFPATLTVNGTIVATASTVGTASKVAFTNQPGATTAGQTIDPSGGVQVSVEDAAGNVVTADNSTVSLTLSSGA